MRGRSTYRRARTRRRAHYPADILARIGREASEGGTLEVVDPKVDVSAGSTRHHDASSVRRELGLGELIALEDALHVPVAVDPDELVVPQCRSPSYSGAARRAAVGVESYKQSRLTPN